MDISNLEKLIKMYQPIRPISLVIIREVMRLL